MGQEEWRETVARGVLREFSRLKNRGENIYLFIFAERENRICKLLNNRGRGYEKVGEAVEFCRIVLIKVSKLLADVMKQGSVDED